MFQALVFPMFETRDSRDLKAKSGRDSGFSRMGGGMPKMMVGIIRDCTKIKFGMTGLQYPLLLHWGPHLLNYSR